MASDQSEYTKGIHPIHLAKANILVIVGKGAPVPDSWVHIARALGHITIFEACFINDGWQDYPYLKHAKHWFSQHPEVFNDYPVLKHTCNPRPDTESDASKADLVWDIPPIGDSSLIATILALDVWGYDKVILTGVPLDGAHSRYIPCWEAQTEYCRGRIASTHGWTMKHFGYPTEQWIGAL